MPARTVFYLLVLLFCWITLATHAETPQAKNAVLDLRNESLTEAVPLNGEWAFYWEQLSDPRDTTVIGSTMVSFPFRWDGREVNGRRLPSYGYATYKLRVLLPKGVSLRLAMPDVYNSYRLFLNGEEAASNGQVSTSEKDFVPHWKYNSTDIHPEIDTLNIVLQIANFAHSRGGIKEAIIIGQRDGVKLSRQRDDAIDFLLTGCLIMGGLFFLGLYLLGNRDNAILYFSLFCLVYSYRIAGIDNYVLHTILPDLSWYVTIRLEYISLFLGICFFARYSLFLYPQEANKKIVNTLCLICIAFVVATLVLPPSYFTQLITPFLFIAIFCILYTPYVYLQAYRKKRLGSLLSLISVLALIVVFAVSLLYYWALIPPFRVFSFGGYITVFFLQSLVLSQRVSFVLNKALKQAEQGLIAKSDFLSTMSHEIRTPLNSVIGMSHLLLKSDPREDQAEKLEVMLFAANNLLSIVNDVLDYSKIEAGKVTFESIKMDLASIVRNIVKGLQVSAEDKGIELRLDIDPALQNKVLGDPTRAYQVISNLVHNAIKFTKAGFVQVGIVVLEQTEQTITLRIEVKDTGIGISADKQKMIFERFAQADSSTSRSFGGTGLGLAISKRILEMRDSSLQLESEEGKGSTFYFIKTFEKSSRTTAQKEQDGNLPLEEDKPLTGISVLLVEDNAMNVMVANSFLQRWGATIDVAVNGQEALEKLDTTKHRLVLMDLHMPVMDGYEAARKMRAMGVTIPIVALTADLLKEIDEDVKAIGLDDIMVKPFLPDELYRKVLHHVFKKELANSKKLDQSRHPELPR